MSEPPKRGRGRPKKPPDERKPSKQMKIAADVCAILERIARKHGLLDAIGRPSPSRAVRWLCDEWEREHKEKKGGSR